MGLAAKALVVFYVNFDVIQTFFRHSFKTNSVRDYVGQMFFFLASLQYSIATCKFDTRELGNNLFPQARRQGCRRVGAKQEKHSQKSCPEVQVADSMENDTFFSYPENTRVDAKSKESTFTRVFEAPSRSAKLSLHAWRILRHEYSMTYSYFQVLT